MIVEIVWMVEIIRIAGESLKLPAFALTEEPKEGKNGC
jgi:hypothetical protein